MRTLLLAAVVLAISISPVFADCGCTTCAVCVCNGNECKTCTNGTCTVAPKGKMVTQAVVITRAYSAQPVRRFGRALFRPFARIRANRCG